ncbi:uncharacterized protein LACBIDRAFT_309317 [Laccaria bicolor S238N-H82]|uniref:Predicted protein n=1 Tax=Laccaria bicolor (strain S238N-H82 / ATCC MYA-4686) TaxID=486041 RepID=B0CW26_LACBS|nr:uncharacterized protein LACBIDRAFT_309309 [Laccaria bicolor S238N-H82]XP_001875940.1 uncharacterized protein LACBIDRAFT_309317 [Laccaria bicolor S238N-H82]EDR13438.1 predicted protein [Laccaria bicolor S238N-H82]EDR13442.1 predicted protein [Laccaria bicolor S238N-H82]|eukprot:XP_001875936.1 predicted protein [Laccaria bicolor S238N-H82]
MFELEEQTQTEILRSNQSSTVLELAKFSWNQELLNLLAALDDGGNLATIGARWVPSRPSAIKLLIVSPDFKCNNEILAITAKKPVWL